MDTHTAPRVDLTNTSIAARIEPAPALTALLDDAAAWMLAAQCAATMMGVTLPAGFAAMLIASRVYTGYAPEQARRALRHREYSEGLRTPPARETRAQRIARDDRAFGLCG